MANNDSNHDTQATDKSKNSDDLHSSNSLPIQECYESKTELNGNTGPSVMSFEEEETYAREGFSTFLTNPAAAMEHFQAGMRRGGSPLCHYGYGFAFFIHAMLTFNEAQQEEGLRVLDATIQHCQQYRKKLPHGSPRRLYYAVLQYDCELFQAFLHFLKQTITGYIKGGLGIRKVWKSYNKTFKRAEKYFPANAPVAPPFSGDSGELEPESRKLMAEAGEEPDEAAGTPLDSADLVDVEFQEGPTEQLTPAEEGGIRRAVYMGYGTFHLMLSLIPDKFLKLANVFGFQGDRRFGLEALGYALTGKDSRQPFAALTLLWFHSLVIPFTALGPYEEETHNISKYRSLLSHLTEISPESPLVLYFSARISFLARDLKAAENEYQVAGKGSFFPVEMLQITCQELALVAMVQNDFSTAHRYVLTILEKGTKFPATYFYLSGLLTGYLTDARDALKLFETGYKQARARPNPVEKFCMRRCAYFLKSGVTYVGMHLCLLEQLYLVNFFKFCPRGTLAENLESVQGSVAGATDSLSRCIGLLAQGSLLKYLQCPVEAEQSFQEILSCNPKPLKNDKHLLVYANLELAILARCYRKDAHLAISYLHSARDKFSDYDFDGRFQLMIAHELSHAKSLRKQMKTEK